MCEWLMFFVIPRSCDSEASFSLDFCPCVRKKRESGRCVVDDAQ